MCTSSPDDVRREAPAPEANDVTERRSLADRTVLWLATGLGVGNVSAAPGTLGSLWGPPLVWGMQEAGLAGWTWGAAALVLVLAGVPICGRASVILRRKDPGCVVFDEIAAFPVVFAVTHVDWATALAGFALFRLFDVWKPWPIRRFEQLPGGWGVMADDLVAAVYAALGLWLASHAW